MYVPILAAACLLGRNMNSGWRTRTASVIVGLFALALSACAWPQSPADGDDFHVPVPRNRLAKVTKSMSVGASAQRFRVFDEASVHPQPINHFEFDEGTPVSEETPENSRRFGRPDEPSCKFRLWREKESGRTYGGRT